MTGFERDMRKVPREDDRDRVLLPRRQFLHSTGLVACVALGSRGAVPERPGAHVSIRTSFPQHDPRRVSAVVGASHGNFERVRELVSEQPALAKASWDWGFGDWETALGAASHTGRREIAEFLIGHGARPTIFSAAMLGQLDTVRAFLTADPALVHLDGPHGISLMRHALVGGPDAQGVVDYLRERFGDLDEPFGFPGDDAVQARYGGRYHFDVDPPFTITVGVRRNFLFVGAGEEPNARVLEAERDVFFPTGAPAVRLRFTVVGGRANWLTIEDGGIVARGARLD